VIPQIGSGNIYVVIFVVSQVYWTVDIKIHDEMLECLCWLVLRKMLWGILWYGNFNQM